MSESTIPPAETVAAPRAAPYTADMDIGRPLRPFRARHWGESVKGGLAPLSQERQREWELARRA